jgi:membrane-bound ClpP family serine protease
MVWISGLTVLGGAGILLEYYSGLRGISVLVLSVLCAVVVSVIVYFFYVKPMENSENSIGFSMQDLTGMIGEVNVPIPEAGFGEVIVKAGAGYTNQIAASFDGVEIEAGERVVIVEVKEHVLYVARLDKT